MGQSQKRFFRDMVAELRELLSGRFLAIGGAIAGCVGALVWFGTNLDPRFHSFCTKPSDTAIVLYFLALPVLLGTSIVGLGELVLWSRTRTQRPRHAGKHAWRACGLLTAAFAVVVAVAAGFASQCNY